MVSALFATTFPEVTLPPILRKLTIPCFIHYATGYYCPGCGATRSLFALLQGKILTSFLYYPAIPVAAFLLLWWGVSALAERLSGRKFFFHFPRKAGWLYLCLALVLGNFLWKNAVLYFTGIALIS